MSKRFQRLATILVTIGMVMSLLPEPALAEMADGLVDSTGEEQTIIVEDSTQEGVQEETATDQTDTVEGGGTEEEEVVVADTAADDETEVADEAAVNETITEAQDADETEVFVEEAETETVAEEAADDVVATGRNSEDGYVTVSGIEGEFATMDDAITAVLESGSTDDITYTVYGHVYASVALGNSTGPARSGLAPNGNAVVSIVGGNESAELTPIDDYHGLFGESLNTLNFSDIKLSDGRPANGGESSDSWEFTYLEYEAQVLNFSNVTFAEGTMISGGSKATFTNCTFKIEDQPVPEGNIGNKDNHYALWLADNANVTVDGCTFSNYNYGAIKSTYNKYATTTELALNVTNSSFTNCGVAEEHCVVHLDGATAFSFTGNTIDDCYVEDGKIVNIKAGSEEVLAAMAAVNEDAFGDNSTINKFYLNEGELTIDTPENVTYTGQAFTPTPTVYRNGTAVDAQWIKYTYADNTDAGTATVTAYYGSENTVSTTFKINAAAIGNYEVQAGDVIYNGTAQEPSSLKILDESGNDVTDVVKANSKITYDDNTNAGEAAIMFIGKNNFKGTAAGVYTIKPCDLATDVTVEGLSDIFADGSVQKLTPVVKVGDVVLDANNYTVTYDPAEPISGTVTVTIAATEGNTNVINSVSKSYDIVAAVAEIDGTQYASLQAALDAAHEMTGDVTVTLLADITEVAVIHQKADLNLTLNGNGKIITGQLYVDGDGRYNGTDTLAIQNVKFAYDSATYDDAFIDVPNTKTAGKAYTTGQYNYAHNVTVTGCEFTGEGTTTVAFRVASGAGANKVALVNNTVAAGHSFAQLTGVKDLTVTGNNVTGVKNGINISGGDGTATITGNTITADATEGYTIRVKDASGMVVTLNDNTFSGGEGLVSAATAGGKITVVSGKYTGPLPTDATKFTVEGGIFSVLPSVDVCAEGKYPIANTDDATKADYPYTVGTAVALVDGIGYTSFTDAVAAAGNDKVITLLADIADEYELPAGNTLKVKLAGHALTVTAPEGTVLKTSGPDADGVTTYTIEGAVAKIEDTLYASLADALDAAEAGDTIKLLVDLDLTGDDNYDGKRMPVSKSVTIDGDGHTVKVAQRGFGVGMGANGNIDVTFMNMTITNKSSSDGRCIDTRGNIGSLTLDHVTLNTVGSAYTGYLQPLTIGGSQSDAAKVTIKDSTIATSNDGSKGYAIIAFNPVNMTITNSTIKGWANLDLKAANSSAGSAGSVVTIQGSTLVSTNPYSDESNAFSAIMVEDKDVTVDITGSTIKVDGAQNWQAIASLSAGHPTGCTITLGEGNKVTLGGDYGIVSYEGSVGSVKVTDGLFNEPVPVEFCGTDADGNQLYPIANTDDATKADYPYTVGEAVASVTTTVDDGEGLSYDLTSYYATFGEAVTAANNGEKVITLLADIDEAYTLAADETLKVAHDGKGLEVKAPEGMVLKSETDADGVTTYTVADAVARIGDTLYASLAEAIAAVPADGTQKTIVMVADENVSVSGYALTVAAGKNVVLDLDGKTVAGLCESARTSALICNLGTLTITDSSSDKSGKLIGGADPTWTWDGSDDYSGSYASNVIRNEGTLVVNGGTLYNASSGSAAYAIDNYSAGEVTINGGTVDAKKASAIRLFYNNGGGITVTGGTIGHYNNDDDCTYMGIQMQAGTNAVINVSGGNVNGQYALYASGSGSSSVTISDGTFEGYVGFGSAGPATISITGGRFPYWVGTWGSQTGFITGGLYGVEPAANLCGTDASGEQLYPIANEDPDTKDEFPYVIGKAVAQNADTGAYYATLQGAVDAAAAGETVKLLKDVSLDESLTVSKQVTLDLDGRTVSSTVPSAILVSSAGDLTIGGNGTISGPTNGKDFDSKVVIEVDGGKLAYLNGTLTATGEGSDGMYGVYILKGGTATFGTAADGDTPASGPTITSHFAAIGTNNTTAPATVTVYGGTYTAKAAPTNNEWWSYFCAPVYAAAAGTFDLQGGTFNGYYGVSSRYANVAQTIEIGAATLNASSGTQVFVDAKTGSAGTADRHIQSASNDETLPAGYAWAAIAETDAVADGMKYEVAEAVAQNVTTGAYYATLQDAIDAATAGQTVKPLKDLALTEGLTVSKKLTLDLDGKTVSYPTTAAAADYEDLILVTSGGDLTITGNGKLVGPENGAEYDSHVLVEVAGGKLTYLNGELTATGSGSDGMYGVYVLDGGAATFGSADGTGPAITSHFAAIGTNNTTAPATVTVYGGTYTANAAPTNNEWWSYFCAPVYAAAAGTFIIQGGTFNGYYGVSSRYANVDQDILIGDATLTASSGTQVFVDAKTGSAGTADRHIQSATNTQTLPDGYAWAAITETASGMKYEVAEAVAQNVTTGAYYATLQDAVDAAGSGETVTLLAAAAEDGVISGDGLFVKADAGKNVTIDFNGLTYNVTKLVGSTGTENQAFHLEKGNAITLKHGTLTSATASMIVQNYCNLTVANDMVLDGTQSSKCSYTLSNNNGKVTIAGTIKSSEGKIAFDVCSTNYYPDGAQVTVADGATINGNIELGVWGSAPATNKATLTVNGGAINGTIVNASNGAIAKADVVLNAGVYTDDPSESVEATYPLACYPVKNAEGKYEIKPSLESEDIEVLFLAATPERTYAYTGFEITPVKDVKVNKGVSQIKSLAAKIGAIEDKVTLDADDYTVTYENNTNAGTATATITGTEGSLFAGTSTTREFKITKVDLATCTIAPIADVEYTGEAFTPEPDVTLGDYTLIKDTDYTVSYTNNTNVGEATVIITAVDGGNFTGTNSVTFNITSKDLSNAVVTGIASMDYTGQAIEQDDLVVTLNGEVLNKGTDYTVAYEENVRTGQATLTITGTGNYSGSIVKTFAIHGTSINTATVTIDPTPTVYTGEAKEPTVTSVKMTINGEEVTLVKDKDYTVQYINNVNAGTAQIVLFGIADFSGGQVIEFTINKATVAAPTATDHTYDGTEKTGVAEGTGYVLTGDAKATDAGDYTAIATLSDPENYTWDDEDKTTAPKELSWSIAQASASITIGAINSQVYNGTALEPAVTVTTTPADLPYELTYSNNVKVGEATVTATITDPNYTAASVDANFDIVAAVAEVNGMNYGTLQEAIEAVPTDGTATTVRLLADITEANVSPEGDYEHDLVAINSNKNVVLDMDGKSLTTDFMYVLNGSLEVMGGTVNNTIYVYGLDTASTGMQSVLKVDSDATIASNFGVILYNLAGKTAAYDATIDIDGTVNGIVWVMGNITEGNSVINVNADAQITGDDVGIGLNGMATVNIHDGASVTGTATGIEARSGNLNVYGGTITGQGTTFSLEANGNGTTTSGAGIAIAQHTTKTPVNVNVYGGDISGYYAVCASDPQNNGDFDNVNVTLTDGTFRATGADGYSVYADKEGMTITIKGGAYSDDNGNNYAVPEGKFLAQDEDGLYRLNDFLKVTPPEGMEFVYNGSEQTGVKTGEGYTLTGTAAATDAGTYTAIAKLADHYAWDDGSRDDLPIEWTIAKAPVTVTADDASKVFGATDPTLTATVEEEDLFNNDTLAATYYTVARAAGEGVGTYAITVTDAGTNKNYVINGVDGTFTITPAKLPAPEAISDQPYTGQALTPTVVIKNGEATLTENTDYTVVSYLNNTELGEAAVIITGAGNYTGMQIAKFNIVEANKDALKAALDAANAARVATSDVEKGFDLEPGTAYVTSAEQDALTAAIEAAQAVYDDPATADEIAAATNALNEAVATYPVKTAQAAVARIGDTLYTSLADAVAASTDGETVELLVDASGAGIFLAAADEKAITIDLGGHTYTVTGPAVGSTNTATQGLHAEKGNAVTLRNGTFTSTADSGVYMLVQNYCDLTLEDVALDGTNLPGNGCYALSNNCGVVTIGSGTTITANEGSYAFDVCATDYYPAGAQVTVEEGATINGDVQYDVWGTKPADNKATLTVNGGTFNGSFDVEAALADDAETNIVINGGAFEDATGHGYEKDGYTLVKEDDGYWRLTPQIDLASATITLTEAEYVYDKSEKLPTVSVTDADGNVVDSNLYTTDVASKTDVGSYTVTVTADENQTLVINEGTANWAIVPAALTSAAAADIAYTGEAVTPNLVVYAGDTTVTAGDYTVTYADAAGNAVTELKEVGSYVATVTGTGNYGGTVVCSFDISQSVAAVTVEAIADQTYDGNPKTPALVVKADGVATTEYTATWINNVNAGTAVVQVTLTGAKTGEALATFTIKPAEVAAPTAAENLVYNGSEQIGVAAGDHYTVTDGAATDAGKYRAVAQLKSANYAWSDGTTTAKLIDWSIAKANVTVTIADIPAQLYSGSAIEPEVTVTTNPKGVAYELSFSNNVEAGNATVTVTTTDPNYNTVIETKDFTIKAAVAKIGDTYFSSVNAAVEAAQDGDTIELLVNKTEKVKVADKTITLDLGGFELSDQKCPLEVSGSADVTVTNGTLKANSYGARVVDSATLTVTDGTTVQSGTWGVYAGNTATLNVKGGEITGVLAISTNGLANQDATINISGGVVNGTVADSDKYSAGVYLPSGTLNITGGTVTGNEAAIAQRGGTVSISGGELSYTNTDAEHVGSIGDRTNSMPVGVIVVDVMTSAYPAAPGATVAAVEGAKLMAPAGGSIVTGFVATDADAVTLNEGVITSEVPVEASIADGCYAKSTDDGLYVITALTELASIDAIDVQAYTGSAIEPAVTVYDENGDVVDPANYEVTYEDNTDAGAATVTVKATGEGYTGELTATFVIAKGTLAGAEVTVDPDSYVFDGSAKEPAVTVTLDGVELAADADYTVAYANNTNAGTATVTITAAEDGLYDGTTGANFTITPADMNSVTVATSTKTYTGEKQVVGSVKLGDYELTAADYDVVYVDNVEVGTATAVLSGKGNFEGMISATFEIVGIDLSEAEVTLEPTSFTYDGTAKEPAVTVTLNDAVIDPANYDVAYADNVEAGTGTATVTGKGGYTGSKSAEFAIVALDKSALAQALNDADAARVAVSDENGFDLEPGTEYVPSAADEALTEAIEAAQAVYDNPAATEEQIAQATKDLNDAIETYKAKIKVAEAAVAMNVETGAYYATLAKAVTGAKNGQTIQMVADTTVSTRIAQRLIAPTYTLDLNGHTVTYDNAASIYHSMPMTREGTITVTDTTGNGKMLFTTDDGFSVSSGATLVVTGGATLKATGDFSPIVVGKNGNVVIENDAAIVADASFAIAATGNDGNGGYSIDVTGGTITSNDVAIYHPNAGTLTISGGEITGATAVYVKSGTTTVSGGTIRLSWRRSVRHHHRRHLRLRKRRGRRGLRDRGQDSC